MPNAFAYIALLAWPVVAVFLFLALPRPAALIWTILGGYLLLPVGVGFDLPMVPTLEKSLIPALSAAILCLVSKDARPARTSASRAATSRPDEGANPAPASRGGRRQGAALPDGSEARPRAPIGWLEWMLLAAFVLGPLVTVTQNSEPILIGPRLLPGLTLYDGVSAVVGALAIIVPYLLARLYLRGEREQILLLGALCVAALAYSLLALIEIRMSPQLSRWVYGFLFQSFAHAMRDGGFRPTVFLQAGLWVALFLAMGLLAATTLARVDQKKRTRWMAAAAWLLIVLALSRSLGALAIALALLPAAALLPVRIQLLLAAAIAAIALAYPALRGAQLVPVDEIVAISESINESRAQSFAFRLRNEDMLLARGNEKPFVGWGGWGRSRIYDPQSGDDISITDGAWIITIGELGWLGYVGRFGLLTLPIFLLALRGRRRPVSLATAGLCLILGANLIDLIPNATLTPVTWLVAGAIMARASARQTVPSQSQPPMPERAGWTRSPDYRPTRLKAPATPR